MELKKMKIEDVADVTKLAGFEFSKYIKYNDDGEIIALRAINIRNNSLDLSDIKRIDKNVSDSLTRSKLNKNDIILTYTGNGYGAVAIIDEEDKYHLAPNICKISPKNIDPYYLYKYITTNQFQQEISNNIGGSGQPTIPMKTIRVLPILVPSSENQNKIAKILKKIDKKINLNIQINNNLSKLEKTIYKEYFKDLANGNQQKLGELCNIKYGKGLPTTKIESNGYPVYGGNGIIGYYHDYIYENSQVLISCRGAASGNVIVSKPQSFVTNNSLILECDRKYHHYLKQYSLDNYYYEYTTGSAQPQITIDNIKDIVINIPPVDLLESFNNQLEGLEKMYFANIEEISRLEQLRDTLLPKLMNGEIDLDNIEI